ncbi:MAG: NifB/NifX family molybdenum-iron cluster-binding protein [Deltaproteobacteria bacterium]|nr:NifB/NifX family molybdenum-iron cluster-binding protein [Deltaproteobacteria bacterium]
MKVGITVWGNRISPVFDSAQMLLVANIDKEEVVGRQIELFQPGAFSSIIDMLAELEIRVLICGALSRGPAALLDAAGVSVIPFMTGEVETVLSLYAKGLDLADFTMPGCPRNRCCGTNQCMTGHQRVRWCWL